MASSQPAAPAHDYLSAVRSSLTQALDALAESPSEAACAEIERILGLVTEAYGKARMARENGTYAASADQPGRPPEFPVPLTATAVMVTIDRLLQAADLNTFELALWQNIGRFG